MHILFLVYILYSPLREGILEDTLFAAEGAIIAFPPASPRTNSPVDKKPPAPPARRALSPEMTSLPANTKQIE